MSFGERIYNTFKVIDVSEYVKDKQGFSYLPWAYAHDIMMQHFPESESRHIDTKTYEDGTMSVTVEVSVREGSNWLSRFETLPVLNGNKPVANPNSFQINTAVKRCFVKCLALHGLGLYLYEGEDMPNYTEDDTEDQILILLGTAKPEIVKKFWTKLGSEDGTELDLGPVDGAKKRPALKWLREQS